MARMPPGKFAILLFLLIIYVSVAIVTLYFVNNNTLSRLDIPPEMINPRMDYVEKEIIENRIAIATDFMKNRMVRGDGHVYLYYSPNEDRKDARQSNSEAMSYYLVWTANEGMKREFDIALRYIETNMIHPTYGFLQWRIEENLTIITDGENMASDADLRAIYALKIAHEKWGDEKYENAITTLSRGLENYGITQNNHLAPYAAISNNQVIIANESWLSYVDFRSFDYLIEQRGEPWITVKRNMKNTILRAQIITGFYESVYQANGEYSNYLDGDAYSINNLWIMVRNAESKDPELQRSARKLLDFYKLRLEVDTELYSRYNSNGYSFSPRADSPWVYPLVARAAIHLDDREFANDLVREMLETQDINRSSQLYGSFPEGHGTTKRASQFTQQEAIITLQDYLVYIS